LVLSLIIIAGTAQAASWQNCEIVSQDEGQVTMRFRLPRYSLEEVRVGERAYSRIDIGGDLVPFAGEGEPDLPVFVIMLATPAAGNARVGSFSVTGEAVHEGVRIIPVARVEARGEGPDRFADHIYDEKVSVYDESRLFPERRVWLADPGRLRNQDVIRVFATPFVYEPGTGRLTVAREITITVSFEGRTHQRGALPVEDAWEGVYENVILNYEQGQPWRVRKRPGLLKSDAITNDRLKILIDRTGMYRLAFDSVSVVGFPEGIAIDDLFMYRDTFREGTPDTLEVVDVAVDVEDNDTDGFFSSGDEIVFYCKDFYDEFGYQGAEDMFFDKNVYWLSWDSGTHERMTTRSGWRDVQSPFVPTHFTDFIHAEKDSFFPDFPPWGDFDLLAWRRFNRSTPFDLPDIHTDYPCSLVVKFASYMNSYSSGAPRNTNITLLMKGCSGVMEPVDTVFVNWIPSIRQFTVPLEAGLLCESDNVFRFESWLDAIRNPGNLLDWFEVFYERRYRAYEDVLLFSSGDATGELEFVVEGFTDSDILLFDITDPSKPMRLTLEPGSIAPHNGGFKLTFRDSVDDGHEYAAVCSSVLLDVSVDQVSIQNPPRLRGGLGDYLVVTHPDFAGELAPLIEQRANQGHIVTLAMTDEVYNDFGNGMKSDVAIKRLIKQAFFGGDGEFVMLVGDANVDRKGILLDPPGDQNPSDVDYVPSHNRLLNDTQPYNYEIRPDEAWFVSVAGEDLYPDLHIGRLSVGSVAEASAVVSKILAFENYEGSDPWKKRLLLAADDRYTLPCVGSSDHHFKGACDSVAAIALRAVVAPDTVKYYLERCTKDDQPEKRANGECLSANTAVTFTRATCTPQIVSLLNSGALMFNYQGHANRGMFTHEQVIRDFTSRSGVDYRDIRDLSNADKPFIFMGYGCWMSDFQMRSEGIYWVGDAIGERFMLNPNGAACASFATTCGDPITGNKFFNIQMAKAMFTNLKSTDVHDNKIPARLVLGEVVTTGLLRYGSTNYIKNHVLLGDPAMVVDMGPPLVSATANGSTVDESYVFEGETFDTLTVVAEIKDEEAIVSIEIDLVVDDVATPVPPDAYTSVALVDTGFEASRAYEVTYDHVPLLGEYVIRLSGEDYAEKVATKDIQIATGSARFLADSQELTEGGQLVFGQDITVELVRPFAFTQDDISVVVDTIPAEEFEDYSVTMSDTEGKEWEVSFMPSLEAGEHTITVDVQGFEADRDFEYVPARIDFFVDGREMLEGDFVSPVAGFEIVVEAEGEITGDDLEVELDGEVLDVTFVPDEASWRASFSLEVEAGVHDLTVRLFSLGVTRSFQLSDEFMLLDVSVFPNPFSGEAYFFYTLTQDVSDMTLWIFTVSGREIFEASMDTFTGYNEFRWDGYDMMGDRVANGTYLYKIVAKSRSGDKEFTGWVVKIE
jgi:hypothetical protein